MADKIPSDVSDNIWTTESIITRKNKRIEELEALLERWLLPMPLWDAAKAKLTADTRAALRGEKKEKE